MSSGFTEVNGGGLLLDPTVQETKSIIRAAYARASQDQATLFLAYIGHGEISGDDFYLMPIDAACAHQRGAGVGGRGRAPGVVAWALEHREPGPLGARRDAGRGRQPHP